MTAKFQLNQTSMRRLKKALKLKHSIRNGEEKMEKMQFFF